MAVHVFVRLDSRQALRSRPKAIAAVAQSYTSIGAAAGSDRREGLKLRRLGLPIRRGRTILSRCRPTYRCERVACCLHARARARGAPRDASPHHRRADESALTTSAGEVPGSRAKGHLAMPTSLDRVLAHGSSSSTSHAIAIALWSIVMTGCGHSVVVEAPRCWQHAGSGSRVADASELCNGHDAYSSLLFHSEVSLLCRLRTPSSGH